MQPDVFSMELQPNDILLLCSDGLSNHVPDRQLRNILSAGDSPTDACKGLIEAALDDGAHDNATAIVAECVPSSRDLSDVGPTRLKLPS